jgi:murein DD-endopeptidase MepM/ murein hydrolase activator NlpD
MSGLARRLSLVLVAVLTSAPAGAADLAVAHRPAVVHPGQVVQIAVTTPTTVSAVSAIWQDREIVLTREADGRWTALVGVDVAEAPGPRAVRVSAVQLDGAHLEIAHTLRVEPKAVRTRRIQVDPQFATPPASALIRIREEAQLLNALFAQTSRERRWSRPAVRPVEGVSVSGFGVRSVVNGRPGGPHNGQDLRAATGTPIHAPTAGVVVYAGELYYTGNTVVLDHGEGLYSTMAHLSVIDVREGDRVETGALLGKVGATGRVTGPHLHWGVRLRGARVDPLSLLDVLASTAP